MLKQNKYVENNEEIVLNVCSFEENMNWTLSKIYMCVFNNNNNNNIDIDIGIEINSPNN